jgi:cytochrome c oxidase cbb3-type subunit III
MNRIATLSALLTAFAALSGCDRERRDLQPSPAQVASPAELHIGELSAGAAPPRAAVANPDEGNAYALSEGMRLYHWYNCSGCHAEGGGDKGPALMDDVWIYGSDPANIFATIVEGRPNGMPAFGGKIPEYQVWQIVAYVRSMSGLASSQAAPNRADAIHAKKPESNVDRQPPVNASTPRS